MSAIWTEETKRVMCSQCIVSCEYYPEPFIVCPLFDYCWECGFFVKREDANS